MTKTVSRVFSGNAHLSSRNSGGWFIGKFMYGELHHATTEVKLSKHSAGEEKDWSTSDSDTLTILVRGCMTLLFDFSSYELEKEGDFVKYGPFRHKSIFHEDSLMVTIRWPKKGKKK